MKKIVRLKESELIQIIKRSINEQGFGGVQNILDPANVGLSLNVGGEEGNESDYQAVYRLFVECRKIPDNQLKLTDSRNIELFNNLYNQIQGLSSASNTVKVIQQIKSKNEFCAVDRLFSRQKKQDLYKELDNEVGLTWGDVLKGVSGFFKKRNPNQL